MAKKLVYNYTFTPGASNVGTIEIEGNYPTKTWQLITDTGTGGTYKHTFVRDELFSSTGAIDIITGGTGDLKVATVGTSLDEDTGIMTVTTSTAHGLSTGATIKFREESVTFTCAKDNYLSEKKYPRSTDPVYDTAIAVTVVDSDTFTVDVGRPVGGNITSDNEIIYNFADSDKQGSAYYFSDTDKTVLTLHHDTSHLDYRDDLQIFLDIQEDKTDFSETYIDPVSKLRVSNPQNLIDTDFEYGLQSTKWETMELVNNIPSFYSSSSDYSITDVINVSSIQGSENITVKTQNPHGLTVGTPIDVQGLGSRTAEGKFIITNVADDRTFVYKSKKSQEATTTLNGSYTVIIPGQFYAGSKIKFDEVSGIETDAANPSSLTINTEQNHGFAAGSSLYLTNTIGRRQYDVTGVSTSIAPDGRPYVDHEETKTGTFNIDTTETETKQWTGTYAYKFKSSAVNVINNTINWPGHELRVGDVLLYVPPSGDAHIGGLERFQIYLVKTASAGEIGLCESTEYDYGSNAQIDLTSQGTSNYGKHQLILGYEVRQVNKNRDDRYCYYPASRSPYTGSGWDTRRNSGIANRNGYWGLGRTAPTRIMMAEKVPDGETELTGGTDGNSTTQLAIYDPIYRPSSNANFTFGKSGTEPDGYDFIEDGQRFFDNGSYYRNFGADSGTYFRGYEAYIRFYQNGYYSSTYRSVTFSNSAQRGRVFCFYLKRDADADTFYIQNHGFIENTPLTITKNSGTDPKFRSDTGTTYNTTPTYTTVGTGTTHNVTVISPNRFKLSSSLNRIVGANGSYTISGEVSNPTANSFYIPDSELVDNQVVEFSTATGGVVPTSVSGALTPDKNAIETVYSATKTALDANVSTMGSDHARLWYNYRDGTAYHWYPFRHNSTDYDGGEQYFYMYRNRIQMYNYNELNAARVTYSNPTYLSSSGFATGEIFDLWGGDNILKDKGLYLISTPFVYNTYTPYWMDIFQVPDIFSSGKAITYASRKLDKVNIHYSSARAYNYNRNTSENQYIDWSNAGTAWNTSLGDGWRYTYTVRYWRPNNSYGPTHGHICMALIITNTNWDGYKDIFQYGSYVSNYVSYSNSRDYIPSASGRYSAQGQHYQVNLILPVRADVTSANTKYGINGSVLTNQAIAHGIATQIKNNLTFAGLSAGTNKVGQVNSNRYTLKNNNFGYTYNLTNSGTTPFTFKTQELTGGVDGYYSIDVESDKTLKTFSNATIPNRTLEFTQTGISSYASGDVYINISNNKLRTGQKLVYDEVSGSISGLTSGTTYYTNVTGPNHFRLASNVVNAESGNFVGIATTSSGSFKFTIPSVSGISAGPGTIGISTTKAAIEGTDTQFKTYFKAGDEFKIADTTQDPAEYYTFNIASVVDDTELTLADVPPIFIASTNYYIESKVYPRPDGAFLHRPFDGGVEINAGTSPNSSIVRQTRKYFRYQSGKGIQCSLAINFNPSRLAKSIVSTGNTSIPSENYSVNINPSGAGSYNLSGNDRDGKLFGQNGDVTVMKGDELSFVVNATGHPVWIKSTKTVGTANSITSDITNNGTQSGSIVWDTSSVTPGTYYYNCENHDTMSGNIIVESAGITTTIAKVSTEYPHGLTRENIVTIRGSDDSTYNGTFNVQSITDFDFSYYLTKTPNESIPNGVLEYNIDSWTNSNVRCGLYDYQNGMFFEYDGNELWCVRRSSVQQLPGKGAIEKNGNVLTGTDTNFTGQLVDGDYIVIRGGSYRIAKVVSRTELHLQPSYQGQDTNDAIITKTVDVKVRQSEWNIDKADGKGPSGFLLDITKIQMAYLDYSWYGAGKIRFGFKDTYGHVKYMHEFRHNNRLEEAYMRTGNIAGRYEIQNNGIPSYVPSLFHWGTSIIMDGKFDDDKAYLFTAASNTLQFTNGDSNSATTNAVSVLTSLNAPGRGYRYYYVRIPFSASDAPKFSSGVGLYTADSILNGDQVSYTSYAGSTFYVYIYVGYYWSGSPPASYPSIGNNTAVSIGAPASGVASDIDLTARIPLISIRLAPSVDNNLTGVLGAREIINRMQLQLKSLGITLTHDCTVDVILNAEISNRVFENVTSPSLSELVKHKAGDKVVGGTTIFSLRASGGAENAQGKNLSATSDFDLSSITDLGNSILGGDGTYPNGPDLLTLAMVPVDTASINADSPLGVSSRVTWTESQA
jgi:plastocyanin